jgi:hypothetical protein
MGDSRFSLALQPGKKTKSSAITSISEGVSRVLPPVTTITSSGICRIGHAPLDEYNRDTPNAPEVLILECPSWGGEWTKKTFQGFSNNVCLQERTTNKKITVPGAPAEYLWVGAHWHLGIITTR